MIVLVDPLLLLFCNVYTKDVLMSAMQKHHRADDPSWSAGCIRHVMFCQHRLCKACASGMLGFASIDCAIVLCKAQLATCNLICASGMLCFPPDSVSSSTSATSTAATSAITATAASTRCTQHVMFCRVSQPGKPAFLSAPG